MRVAEEDPEPQGAVPQSPTPSALFSDADSPLSPPPPNGSIEIMSVDDPFRISGDDGAMSGATEAKQCDSSAKQLERRKGSDDSSGSEHKPIQKCPAWEMLGDSGSEHEPVQKHPMWGMSKDSEDIKSECEPVQKHPALEMSKESDDDDSGEGHRPSRSTEASRKLKELVRNGKFVVDEGKRERFEEKCCRLDGAAMFRYRESWKVRHSKCSKWVTMQEPYNLVRFGEHVKGCKHTAAKTHNGTISQYFKPRDPKETGAKRMAQPTARRQIYAGASTKFKEMKIKPNSPSIPFTSKERPCLGLGKEQDERIDTYISRVIAEGAGSRSDADVTKTLFGDGIKYSELDETSKRFVAAAQVHSQKWRISRTLGTIFSSNCEEKVDVVGKTQSSVCSECLRLLKLDTFKKALRVQPPPLENLKYTPHRRRNAATSLGINLAKIEGVSGLLERVNYTDFHNLAI